MKVQLFGILQMAVASAMTAFSGGVPEATITEVRQGDDKVVTITYALANAPAVVTMDVQTNCTATGEWVSIGGAALQGCTAESDVWKMVSGKDSYAIRWRPHRDLPGLQIPSGQARVVLTAWAANDTPDYLVADLSADGAPHATRYYPSVDCLPGGLFGNEAYRTTKLVMRKIRAKDVAFAMGSYWEGGRQEEEKTYVVSLTNNFYLGVFEVTQKQLETVTGANPSMYKVQGALRPVEQITYYELRNSADATANPSYDWPADPNPDSVLGRFRTRTGLDFDLPSDAQWEFACRAGTFSRHWNDGSPYISPTTDENLAKLGRYRQNGGWKDGVFPDSSVDTDYATAIVGTFDPNGWGLYDMHGNVFEWCLDYGNDVVAAKGRINIDPTDSTKTASGTDGSYRGVRGGCFSNTADYCRSAYRNGMNSASRGNQVVMAGFRLCCQAGLK